MPHLVMFDIDGTLTHTYDVDSRCYVQAMSEYLGSMIDDDWSQYEHVTDSGIASQLFDQHQRPKSDLPKVRQRFVSLLEQSFATEPYDCRQICGAAEFVRRLRETSGIVLGLATGGWAESAQTKLQHAGIDVEGLAFASADDAEAKVQIMTICRQRVASLANVDCLPTVTYIGDGLWDARAAAQLGWQFIGISSGSRAEQLRIAGARRVFEDFSDSEMVLRAINCN